MFCNRLGSVQHCANTSGHPDQYQAYRQAKDILYQWLPIVVKLQFLPGVHIPRSDTYTARVREEEDIATYLQENFEVVSDEVRSYEIVAADLLLVEVDVIAHVAECCLAESFGLARQIADATGCDACIGRQRDGQTLRCTAATQSQPGTLRLQIARDGERHVAHLYAQREHGPATVEETEVMRYGWLKQCLIALAECMRQEGWTSVALPYHIACGNSNGDWIRYEQIINQWALQYSDDFTVFVVQKT